ncbi:MAG: hypothetical protein K8R85_09690 [Bacteroidetes bacterium]|nr:hypothetical protein [Bacteroidota bacterium]
MKFLFCIIFICTITISVFAQKTDWPNKNNSIFIGVGNYEYLNVGFNTSIKQKHYVEVAVGIKPWGFNSSKYQMAYFCLGTKLFKERTFIFTPNIHLKCLLWNFSNDYNRFVVLGINPEFRITKTIKNNLEFSLTSGILYNSPLYYQRKTYLEIGWPKQWQPSFGVQFFYFIK